MLLMRAFLRPRHGSPPSKSLRPSVDSLHVLRFPRKLSAARLPPKPASAKPPSTPQHTRHAPSQPLPRRRLKTIAGYALTALSFLAAIDFLFTHGFQLMTVTGPSMYPFLNTDYNSSSGKDTVFVNMWKPYASLHRGQVVAFYSPRDPNIMAVKRIIALPGDLVATRPPYPVELVEIPPGHVWVEGEHPEGSRRSYDSNIYGPVSMSLLVGKVRGVVWPWSRAGGIRWEDWRGSERVKEGRPVEKVEIFGLG